jgi:hypothetical protein
MTLAVGRLQFSITFSAPQPRQEIEEPPDNSLERIFRTDRRHQNVDAERQRWQTEALAHAGRLF